MRGDAIDMVADVEHATIETNGLRLHVVQAGPKDGTPVILLHGFPEFWYGWRRQIPYLAAQGFRVWAPDQRGYNLSDKPKELRAYTLDETAKDVIGLIDAMGTEQVYLAGHDWGAAVTWWTAARYPERVKKIAILNVPHPSVMQKTLATNWEQRRRSWYIFFFQIPHLPEWMLGARNGEGLAQALIRTSQAGAFEDRDLAEYRKAWAQPGAVKAMIDWYRTTARAKTERLPDKRIHMPTLILWGKRDHALSWPMAQASADLCDEPRVVYFDEATHWVQHEEANRINPLLAEFFQRHN